MDDSGIRGFPGRPSQDSDGHQQFARFLDFIDRATADQFRDQILGALDAHLAEAAQ
jgi:hypothetical protein